MNGSPITFIVAFIVVLALIGVAAWLVRRFATTRLGANTQRGRMPRLAVIDAAAVDGRRRLVLVRRDNVEHLLMIGGPTDIVVEPNIVRAAAGRDQLPQRPNAAEPPRLAPMPDTSSWADEAPRPEVLDHPEPQMPEPPPRPARPSFADEVRRPAPALAERRSDPLAGFTSEPIAPRPEREPRPEPMPPRVARSEPPLMPRPPRQNEPVKVPPRPCRRLLRLCRRLRPFRRRPLLRRRTPNKISPKWPSASRPPCAVRLVRRSPLRLHRSRRQLRRAQRASSRRRLRPRPPGRLRRRPALRISKTRWPPCSAVRSRLREAAGPPA
jgi:hypothetical protein